MSSADGIKRGTSEFRFEECHIPGPHSWTFELDDKGVYQVYDDIPGNGMSRLFLNFLNCLPSSFGRCRKAAGIRCP